MKTKALILSIGLLLAILKLSAQSDAIVKHVSAVEFNKIVSTTSTQLIDIRTPEEYNAGHIKGAIMIDYYAGSFRDNFNKLDKEKAIYIYCRSGNRSGRSVAILKELGFKEIVNLQRGMVDWNANKLPLSTQ